MGTILLGLKNPEGIELHYFSRFYDKIYRQFILSNSKIEYKTVIRKMIDMDKEPNFSTTKKKLTCELVANIIKPLFFLLGYKDYDSDLWVLKIVR